MTQRNVAKTYVHHINISHVQVPLYQSRGMARDEFSTHLFTSGSILGETKYKTSVTVITNMYVCKWYGIISPLDLKHLYHTQLHSQ
jgi:hypothetical protein